MKKLNLIYISKNADKLWHQIRWQGKPVYCPICGSLQVYHCHTGYKCKDCGRRFTDKTNTLLHGSKLDIVVWLMAMFLIHLNNGISSVKLGKDLGINQKSAWLLLTKLRVAMQDDIKLEGNVCIDECYLGASFKNMHYLKKVKLCRQYKLIEQDKWQYNKKQILACQSRYKTPVFGMTANGKVRLFAMPNPIKDSYIRQVFMDNVVINDDTLTVSDESKLYNNWMTSIKVNCHSKHRYMTDGVTSNPIENRFSWLKRNFKYHYTHFKKENTQLYLNEYQWRFNRRNLSEKELLNELFNLISKPISIKGIDYLNDYDIQPTKPLEQFSDFKGLYPSLFSSITIRGEKRMI